MSTTDTFTLLLKKGYSLFTQYTELEHVPAYLEQEYLAAFKKHIEAIKAVVGTSRPWPIVTNAESETFYALPSTLRLYRGYYEPDKRAGISWSLSRRVADGFAHGPYPPPPMPPMVVTGKCLRSKVLVYSNSRDEQELIVDPFDVRELKNIKVRPAPPFPVVAEPLEELLEQRQHHGSEILKV
jgi:hypothetical protein